MENSLNFDRVEILHSLHAKTTSIPNSNSRHSTLLATKQNIACQCCIPMTPETAVSLLATVPNFIGNGVNDGGTTECTQFAWLNRRCFKVYYAVYCIGIALSSRIANNIQSKFSEFSIDYNTNLPKMVQECIPEVAFTSNEIPYRFM